MLDLLRLPGIAPYDIDQIDGEIIIKAKTKDDEKPMCPECGGSLYKHGRRTNVFADTPMEMMPVKVEIDRQRYRCGECRKVVIPDLDFLDEKRLATKRLVNAIMDQCLSKTFTDMSEQTGMAINTIKAIAKDLTDIIDKRIQFATPTIMGIDEVNLAGGMRCVITNLGTHTLYDMLEKRTQDALIPYFAQMPDKDKVEWVCTDMWRPFKKSFAPAFPNATLIIDKFHVVKMASEALDTERKKFQKDLDKDARVFVKKSLRWLILRRPADLSDKEAYALSIIKEKLPELGVAYDLKEAFYRIYDEPDKESAQAAFEAWANVVPKEMKDFVKAAKTVNNHFQDIFAYWDSPQPITNGYTEARNGVIKVTSRIGRGYSFDVIRAKVLYAKLARQVGAKVLTEQLQVDDVPGGAFEMISMARTFTPNRTSARVRRRVVEFGPHIPTLAKMAEDGMFE